MFELYVLQNITKIAPKFLLGIIQGQSKCILVVKQSYLIQVVNFFSRSLFLQFNILSDITAADYPNNKNRFVVIYSFLSLLNNMRVFIKVHITALTYLPSLSNILSSSNWLEREVWDMYGIFFNGHFDLRRILTDYGFLGFPLRKEFPLTGFFELRYDDSLKRVVMEPLEVAQELRVFYFTNP